MVVEMVVVTMAVVVVLAAPHDYQLTPETTNTYLNE